MSTEDPPVGKATSQDVTPKAKEEAVDSKGSFAKKKVCRCQHCLVVIGCQHCLILIGRCQHSSCLGLTMGSSAVTTRATNEHETIDLPPCSGGATNMYARCQHCLFLNGRCQHFV